MLTTICKLKSFFVFFVRITPIICPLQSLIIFKVLVTQKLINLKKLKNDATISPCIFMLVNIVLKILTGCSQICLIIWNLMQFKLFKMQTVLLPYLWGPAWLSWAEWNKFTMFIWHSNESENPKKCCTLAITINTHKKDIIHH